VAPALTGDDFVGGTQALGLGTWTAAVAYQRAYIRLPFISLSDTGATRVIAAEDAGQTIVGAVRGQDAGGIWSRWYVSNPVTIAPDVPLDVWAWEDGEPMAWEDGELIQLEAA
jgi:hypothetical protein